MALARFGGIFNAAAFAYGINPLVPPLQVLSGPAASGSGALTLIHGYITTADGLVVTAPLNTNAPIIVGGNSNIETVTPSAVSNTTPFIYASPTVTATYSNVHGNGDSIRSGTYGLQEALNYAGNVYGGGTVIIDAGWTALGGTTAIVQAAVVPAGVSFQDNRGAGGSSVSLRTQQVLTNAQILTLSSTAVQVLPAPGAGYFYNILKATLVNEVTGTAYTGGGAITIGYSSTPIQALSGTIAASFLTTGTTFQVIQLAGANLAATTEAQYDNQGIFINCATANFAAGTGTLRVSLVYTVESK